MVRHETALPDPGAHPGRIALPARRERAPCRNPLPNAEVQLSHVQAWNEVVLNQVVPCSKCGAELARGATPNATTTSRASCTCCTAGCPGVRCVIA